MPRASLIRTKRFAYHLTTRSNNREWFYLPLAECWDVFTKRLARTVEYHRPEIHLMVLMSNHVHLIASTPDSNVDEVMRYFLSGVAQEIQRRTGRINHVFGGRYRWSVLENAHALVYVYKYVARNPVRADVCARVEDYPFSTRNDPRCGVPVVEGFDRYWSAIPKQSRERLAWLNTAVPKEQESLIGRALRRYRFQFTTHANVQRQIRLLRAGYGVEPAGGSDTFW